jgi:hypothetical protein
MKIVTPLKMGFNRGAGTVPKAFWTIPVRFPSLDKGKSIENRQTGLRDSLLGAVAA